MDPNIKDLLDLILRWMHLIAGIMWVGNSMLFNWLDRNLVPKEGIDGEIWMVHSGGFYQVEKKQLAPSQMPKTLHWFYWQSGITWMTGFSLLGVVYYMGAGGAYLLDPSVSNWTAHEATMLGVGVIVGAWIFYDLLWKSPLGKIKDGVFAVAISFLALGAIAYGLTHIMAGRAAYIHVGAMMGTLMAGNVFMQILPSQRKLVAATIAGKAQDKAVADAAKQRSIHNNYMTFPVLFIMLSNHYPSTYGSELKWIILGVLIFSGAGIRHFMNIRYSTSKWAAGFATTATVGVATLFLLISHQPTAKAKAANFGPDQISFTAVNIVIAQRCRPCHSATPTDATLTAAPAGVMFDTPEQIKKHAERIKARAVISKTMPLGNKTGISQEERDLLGQWFVEGASITK